MIRASFLLGLLFPLAATLSQGTYISPDMPFMLFGSDNVGKIQFSEAPCVFIAAASGDGLSKVTFTPGNLEGPFGYSVNASIFADTVTFVNGDSNVKAQFGAFCFPDNTGYLRTDFGNYTGLDSTSPQWRSTLLYFMPKKSVTGPCKGKGTHKLGGNVFILFDRAVAVDASSECPAVVLAPSNIQFDLAYSQTGCVGIGFSRQSNSIDIDISTVQNGASPLKDATFLTWKANDKSSSNVQTFLRNAVLLRTNSSSWISNIAKLSYENTYNDDANTCKLSRSLDDFATSASGRIDTDPYGSEQMIYTLNMPFASDHAITNFDFSDNSFDCFTMDLTITTTDAPGVNFQSTITDREQLQIINLDAITFSYKQQTMSTDSCANFQLVINFEMKPLVTCSNSTASPNQVTTMTISIVESTTAASSSLSSSFAASTTTSLMSFTTTSTPFSTGLSTAVSTALNSVTSASSTSYSTTISISTSTPPTTSLISSRTANTPFSIDKTFETSTPLSTITSELRTTLLTTTPLTRSSPSFVRGLLLFVPLLLRLL